MKDVFGTTIEIGDFVAFTASGYADLFTGIVEKITAKMVIVRFGRKQADGLIKVSDSVHRCLPTQVVVKTKQKVCDEFWDDGL